MKLYIDRIENNTAICEDECGNKVLLSPFPEGAREGSVLAEIDGSYSVDEGETAARRKKLFELQGSLFDK